MNYYVIICTAFIVLTFLAANIVAWLIFYHAYQIYICAKGILSTVRSSAAHFKQREFSSRQVEEMSRQFGFNLHKAKQETKDLETQAKTMMAKTMMCGDPAQGPTMTAMTPA